MSNQDFDSSDPTLAKLLDISADLAAKEAQLQAQLEELQEKRNSLKTVISLFSAETTSTTAAPVLEPVANAGEVNNNGSAPAAVQEPPAATKAPARKRGPRSTATKTRPTTTKRAKGKGKRGASGSFKESWQPYLQDEFLDMSSLPDIVSTVLERHQGQVLSARNIMSSIFEDDMPQSDYQKVHHRLLTILSKGVKDERWIRGNKGEYSIPTRGRG